MSQYVTDLPKAFVLCFDGTGNKFSGDESDSNVLKIFRTLDRNQGQQFHYYQPGIGTYITSTKVPNHTGAFSRIKRSWIKAKDVAIGFSFDHHVLAGYQFLMRYYSPGDEIYFFGFSRGAYIARFLAEMLDYIGLLTIGNEELVQFAWKTFSEWQRRTGNSPEDIQKRRDLFKFMKAFRETFSRPIQRIRFLGLFDTVNSVPKFESPWMSRNRFPYTARSSAKVIRHAVGIDERRAKFRQDLISQDRPFRRAKAIRRRFSFIPHGRVHDNRAPAAAAETIAEETKSQEGKNGTKISDEINGVSPSRSLARGWTQPLEENRYRPCQPRRSPLNLRLLVPDNRNVSVEGSSLDSISHIPIQVPQATDNRSVESDQSVQDIQEVWFPGCHADIGGGWALLPGEKWPLSHAPLVWMIHEAQRAGLQFDERKLKKFECAVEYEGDYSPIDKSWNLDQGQWPDQPEIVIDRVDSEGFQETPKDSPVKSASSKSFFEALQYSGTQGRIHDSLAFNSGLPATSVIAWRIMEYLPFKRMDLQEDGSWAPIRWPLPRGEVRDIPLNAKIHTSAIQRLRANKTYRPGNLIIGGGGRGVKKAPEFLGIGDWVVSSYEGDPVRETFVRVNISKNECQRNGTHMKGTQKNGIQEDGTQKNGTQKNGIQKDGNGTRQDGN
ncbi:hypothetical protein ACO22_03005 [Paracoccidioides brasiliensis]|uniref:T6SS Phospholipase effector Tle1-like catalytic domain-containing protein n=1 Tax=Paracoccidioides brasiliensis TaxID=121759 RepID=A0A1D2JH64_PARBR|nr:hypothetical protein ACO22_03005 [Paracoccidioides brasiliensis]